MDKRSMSLETESEKLVLQHPHPGPFDSQAPRHRCCRLHTEGMSKWIAIVEIVFNVVFLFVIIGIGVGLFTKPAIGLIIGGVVWALFGIVVAALVLVGLHKMSSLYFIPYLIFKGFQMFAITVALIICLLSLLGFSALYGLVAATKGEEYEPVIDPWAPSVVVNGSVTLAPEGYEPADPDGEGEDAVNSVTIVFASLLSTLMAVLVVLLFFVIVVFKGYRYLRERSAYQSVAKTPPVGATEIILKKKKRSKKEQKAALVDTATGDSLRKVSISSQTGENGYHSKPGECDCEPGSLCPHCEPKPFDDSNIPWIDKQSSAEA